MARTIQELVAEIEQLTNRDEINAVVTAVRFAQTRSMQAAVTQFRRFDVVKFTTPNGLLVIGTVERVNAKTLTLRNCRTENGGMPPVAPHWRVAPTFCTKVSA